MQDTEVMPTNAEPVMALSASDRCDRCNAQAYVRAMLSNGFELLFCGHHFATNEAVIRDGAILIQDGRDALLER